MPNESRSIKGLKIKRGVLLVIFSVTSLLFSILPFFIRGGSAIDRALINLIVIISGSILFCRNLKRWEKMQLFFISIVGLIGMLASLLFSENYAGGEWLFHLHKGYPYSWLDGGFSTWPAVEKGIPVTDYIVNNPGVIQWNIDVPAFVIDLLFWMNVSIIIFHISQTLLVFLKKRFHAI
jgi:hypothetical protein